MKLFSFVPLVLALLMTGSVVSSPVIREAPEGARIKVVNDGMYAKVAGPSLCQVFTDGTHCACCPGNPDSCQMMPYGTLCKYVGGGNGVTYVPVYGCWEN